MYNKDYRNLSIDRYLSEAAFYSFSDSFNIESTIELMKSSLDLRYIKINPILLGLQNHRDLYEFLTDSSSIPDLINCITNFDTHKTTDEIFKSDYTDYRNLNFRTLSVMFYLLFIDQIKNPVKFKNMTKNKKTEYYLVFSYVFNYFTSVSVEQKIRLLKIILETEWKVTNNKSENKISLYVKTLNKLSKSPTIPFEWFVAEEFGQ